MEEEVKQAAKSLRSIIPHIEMAISMAKIENAPSTDVRLGVLIYRTDGTGRVTASFEALGKFMEDLKLVCNYQGPAALLEEMEEDEKLHEEEPHVPAGMTPEEFDQLPIGTRLTCITGGVRYLGIVAPFSSAMKSEGTLQTKAKAIIIPDWGPIGVHSFSDFHSVFVSPPEDT